MEFMQEIGHCQFATLCKADCLCHRGESINRLAMVTFGGHSIMMVSSSQPGEGGRGMHAHPLSLYLPLASRPPPPPPPSKTSQRILPLCSTLLPTLLSGPCCPPERSDASYDLLCTLWPGWCGWPTAGQADCPCCPPEKSDAPCDLLCTLWPGWCGWPAAGLADYPCCPPV